MDSKTRQNRPDVRLRKIEHKIELTRADTSLGATVRDQQIAYLEGKAAALRERIAARAARQVLAICVSPEAYQAISAGAKAESMTRKAYVERAVRTYREFAESFGKVGKPVLEVRG